MLTPSTSELESFGHLELCQTPGTDGAALSGSLVDLCRRGDEVACLAWDTSRQALVELHLLADGQMFSAEDRRGFSDLSGLASKLVGEDFGTVLDHGESAGMLYYTTPVSDGELLAGYVSRVGPTDAATAVPMVRRLCETLAKDETYFGFVPAADPAHVMVVLDRAGRLRLRLVDFGLADRGILDAPAPPEGALGRSVVRVLSLLLTTHPTVESQHFAQAGRTLSAWPRPLETLLRRAFTAPTHHWPLSIAEILSALRDTELALQSLPDGPTGGGDPLIPIAARRPRTALEALIPSARQARELLEDTPFELDPLTPTKADRSCIAVRHRVTHEPCRLLLLPGRNVIADRHLQCIPARRNDTTLETPHLVQVVHSVRSDAFRACIEECPPHVTLEDVLAARQQLSPGEALRVLDEVVAGLSEAGKAGVQVPGLTPCDVWLIPGNKPSAPECGRLAGRPLDEWPGLSVKLRVHLALPSLMAAALDSPRRPAAESTDQRMAHEFFNLVARMFGKGTGEPGSFAAFRRLRQWQEEHQQSEHPLPVTELLANLRLRLTAPNTQPLAREAAMVPPLSRYVPVTKPPPPRPSRYENTDSRQPASHSAMAPADVTPDVIIPGSSGTTPPPPRELIPSGTAPSRSTVSPGPLLPPSEIAGHDDPPLPESTVPVRRQLIISLEDARGRHRADKTLPLTDGMQPQPGRLAAEFRILRPARVVRTGPITTPAGPTEPKENQPTC